MPSKRHAAVWLALANHLNVNQRSMKTFKVKATSTVFFTTLLPSLGKDLDRGLCSDFVLTASFKKQRGSELPQFLYELFIRIFHKDGRIRIKPEGIQDLRQLLMMFYKFEEVFSESQLKKATEKYIDTDARVKTRGYPEGLSDVRKNFLTLLPDNPWDIRPHHSNGVTADRVSSGKKLTVRRLIPSLMKYFSANYFFNSHSHAKHWCSLFKTETASPRARVSFVPKDSRGPRTICMEPHELMFIQKGLQTKLYDYIENYSPAKGYVNFTDQGINQRLAYLGSLDGTYATIDLKDASDLVAWNLISMVVSPEWYLALKASRSAYVDLPDSTTMAINKFASMGSALCFPIEAMLFWSISRTVCPQVYVYGDDIIVPVAYAEVVISALEAYGLIINRDKTLTTGLFRESCGAEYYCGTDISYVKCKSYDDVRFIAFANLMRDRYGCSLTDRFVKIHEDFTQTIVMRQPLEHAWYQESCVYYTNHWASSHVFFKRKYDAYLQQYFVRWKQERSENKDECIDDYDRFFYWLTSKSTDVAPEEQHTVRELVRGVYTSQMYNIRRRFGALHSFSSQMVYGVVKPYTKFTWGVLRTVV